MECRDETPTENGNRACQGSNVADAIITSCESQNMSALKVIMRATSTNSRAQIGMCRWSIKHNAAFSEELLHEISVAEKRNMPRIQRALQRILQHDS
jgi:hypothetical protein